MNKRILFSFSFLFLFCVGINVNAQSGFAADQQDSDGISNLNTDLHQQLGVHLRVASYNLRMDTPRDSINAWPNRKEEVRALLRYHDLDIVGTQEGFIHQLLDLCGDPAATEDNTYTPYTYYGVGRDDGQQAGEHSAILYKKERFHLLDAGDFWLSEAPDLPGKGWDATCCNRICSWVRLEDQRSGEEFFVFNVHFDHQGKIAREQSAILMLSKISEIAGDMPMICTGDFNSTPETIQIRQMSGILADSYEVTEQPPYGPVGTFNGFKWDAGLQDRIDYVFVSGQFRVQKYAALTDSKNQRFPSDHLPVVADLFLLPLTSR